MTVGTMSSLTGFLYGIAHVTTTEELGFFDIDGTACLRCSYQQVGLPAQEGGYLYHVADFAHGFCLPGFVDVRQYPESIFRFDIC